MNGYSPDDDLDGLIYDVRDDLLRTDERFEGRIDDLTEQVDRLTEQVDRLVKLMEPPRFTREER